MTGTSTAWPRLAPAPHKALLAVHLQAAVSLLGADLALVALGVAGVGGADPRTIYPAARLVAAWVLAPLAVAALLTGVLLGLMTRWGVLRHWWVAIKFGLTLVLTAVVLGVLVPSLGRRAADVAAEPPVVISPTERVPPVIAPAVGSTLLLVTIGLAVFKPGGRIRGRIRAAPAEGRAVSGASAHD